MNNKISTEIQNSDDECTPIANTEDSEDGKKEDETISSEIGVLKKQKPKKRIRKSKKTTTMGNTLGTTKKINSKTSMSSPRIPSKSIFAQIAKELKAKRLAQMAHAIAMSKKRKKNRVLRDEEIYTDKDRAAAVNVGTSDIKQSLKMKDKQNKNYDSQIPEESDSATLLALGNNELRSGDIKTALNFINKALELNPDDKNGLIARSKCYLSIGKPELALKDAETALLTDKTLVRAIYQKAEALYHLGDFEHSLMYYHRGHRLRPELETFRLGIQKAQEAIEITIGVTSKSRVFTKDKKISSEVSSAKTESNRNEYKSSGGDGEMKKNIKSFGSEKENKTNSLKDDTKCPAKTSRKFRGDLSIDRSYLENLLTHPDLACLNQEDAADLIKVKAEEGISFLKSRQKFWKQRKPNITPVKLIK